ncbi:MAG: LytR family transcriptional regulator [Lachnospiraceae bacterium]|nr:LytR family transcriptional regulator [Lachnospiraceae bacterium]
MQNKEHIEKALMMAKKVKKKSKWKAPLIVMVIILVLFGGAWAVFARYYNLSNFVKDEEVSKQAEENSEEVEAEDNGLTSEEEEVMRIEAESALEDTALPENENVYNILLIGVDRRDRSWSGNSDSMILLSINHNTKSMHMISFMRDLYADIPGKGVHKLNAACAYGGGPLLVQTIEQNYKVNIDNYASVDFPAMIKIIDYAGGVELTLSEREVQVANDYIRVMCEEQHEDFSKHKLPGPGTYNCDGFQAVGHARNRFIGNSDYQRTERQRTVLTKIMERVKAMSVTEMNRFVENVLPLVTHNVESSTMLDLISKAPSILKEYSLGTSRVPYDGMFSSRGEILYPDMKETIQRLQDTINADGLAEWEKKSGDAEEGSNDDIQPDIGDLKEDDGKPD